METFRGNTSSDATSEQFPLPKVVNNFTLVNKTGGGISVNVYLLNDGDAVSISAFPTAINAGAIYTDIIPRLLRTEEQIKLVTTGDTDYSFEINNIEP